MKSQRNYIPIFESTKSTCFEYVDDPSLKKMKSGVGWDQEIDVSTKCGEITSLSDKEFQKRASNDVRIQDTG